MTFYLMNRRSQRMLADVHRTAFRNAQNQNRCSHCCSVSLITSSVRFCHQTQARAQAHAQTHTQTQTASASASASASDGSKQKSTPTLESLFGVSHSSKHNKNKNKNYNKDVDNAYRDSTRIHSALKTQNARHINLQSKNPILVNDKICPIVVDRFKTDIYSKREWRQFMRSPFFNVCSIVEPYRSLLMDGIVSEWTRNLNLNLNTNHQSSALHVIELGIGFDFRMERILAHSHSRSQPDLHLDSQQRLLFLYELDLPNVTDVRQCLIRELSSHSQMLPAPASWAVRVQQRQAYRNSIFDMHWMAHIQTDIQLNENGMMDGQDTEDSKNKNKSKNKTRFDNVLFISEGLFLHLSALEMQSTIVSLCERFPGCHVLFDEKMDAPFTRKHNHTLFELKQEMSLFDRNTGNVDIHIPFWFRMTFGKIQPYDITCIQAL